MTAQWLGNSYAVTVKKTATPVLLWFHSYIGLACVMLSCLGEMVATVGFLRREPQDCNQSLCQKRAPWAPLRLIQPNNKQQITALACRQEQSPRGLRAGETGVFCLSPACAETSPRFEGRIGRFMWRAEFFTPLFCYEQTHLGGPNRRRVRSVKKSTLCVPFGNFQHFA